MKPATLHLAAMVFVCLTDSAPAQEIRYATWNISTVAGTGTRGNSGVNGPATQAQLSAPSIAHYNPDGTLLFWDLNGYARIDADGTLRRPGFSGDILGQRLNGNYLLRDTGSIEEVDPSFNPVGRFRTLTSGQDCNNGIREAANGTAYCMTSRRQIIRLNAHGASSFGTTLNIASATLFAVDSRGAVYSLFSGSLRYISTTGTLISVTSSNSQDFTDGPASSRAIANIDDMAFDADGNLLFLDTSNSRCRLRMLTTARNIVTLTRSSGACGYSGDGGPVSSAALSTNPLLSKLAISPNGDVAIADTQNHAIRRVFNPSATSMSIKAVSNAASFEIGYIVPGEIITAFGTSFTSSGLESAAPANGVYPTQLRQTRLLVDGVPAPLIYVSPDQLSAIVPFAVAGRPNVRITIENGSDRSPQFLATIGGTQPGIFTLDGSGRGLVAAINAQDATINGPNTPARRGSVVTIFATGLGTLSPTLRDGEVAGFNLSNVTAAVDVTVSGFTATVTYAGSAPGLVAGVYQINFVIPDRVAPGDAPLRLRAGLNISRLGLTVAVAP